MTRHFTVLARDPSYRNLGSVGDYSSLQAIPRFNDVGSWSLTYAKSSRGGALLKAAGGIRIFRAGATAGDPVISGPVMNVTETLDPSWPEPLLTFSGPCDNIWLAQRLAYPVPSSDVNDQNAAIYDVRSGVAEAVMKGYVADNAGPGAVGARPVNGLTVAANLNRGASVSTSARFYGLLSVLQGLAVSGGLGFKVQQIGHGLVFDVYEPADLSKRIRFSTSTGSLGAYTFQLTGPTGTAAIVGDGTSGAGRSFAAFHNVTAEADWNMRVETFVDQSDTTDAAQIAQAGQQALDTGSPQAQVTFSPNDTPQRQYGIDYGLGDMVTVQLDSAKIVDVVREVTIADDTSSGLKVSPTVGSSQAADPSTNPAIYQALRSIALEVGLLQRRR